MMMRKKDGQVIDDVVEEDADKDVDDLVDRINRINRFSNLVTTDSPTQNVPMPTDEQLLKVDKLLKNLRDNVNFLKNFSDTIEKNDDAANELKSELENERKANNSLREQGKKSIKVANDLRNGLENEMKTNDLLRKGGEEAMKLLEDLKN